MRQSNTSLKQKQGFSLVELLVVMAIIATLMGLVLGVSGSVSKKAAVSKCKGELANLMAEIEIFKADNGRYPASNGGAIVLESTEGDPDYPGFMDWYEEKYPNTRFDVIRVLEGASSDKFVDPWGREIIYDSVNEFTYRIGSKGPDGKEGDGTSGSKFGEFDDITNRRGGI